jgi:hypothetical protein
MEFPAADLFSDERLYLPVPREGETLYSWCAHYHTLSSNPTARQTCLQLFGHPHAGLKHDFPICLDKLTERTEGLLGTRAQIIFNRTPVGAFSRFIDSGRLQAICDLMGTGPSHRVARMLGLLAITHGTPAPLKACTICVRESVATTRSSLWLCEHQIPGVYRCHKHDCLLLVANESGHRRARNELLLPHMLGPSDWHETPALSSNAIEQLNNLAQWSRTLRTSADMSFEPFEQDTLRYCCHFQAKRKNWIGIDGCLHFKKIREAIWSACVELSAIPGLEFLEAAQREAGGYVGILLRQYGGVHHPLMHIALLAFLFDSPDQLFEEYRKLATIDPASRRDALKKEREALSQRLAIFVAEARMSVNQAAQAEGIAPTIAIRYLKELGIEYETRPRIVGSPIEPQLIERLKRGDNPMGVASALGIRRNFIKDYLATRPALRQEHETKRFRRLQEEYRTKFLRTLAANPSLPIKRIRRESNSGFEWLYRNDREWLTEILPGVWHR